MKSTTPFIYTVLIAIAVVNILQATFTPILDDEAYYWTWSQHLAWGYFDHPPMIALWIHLGFSLFPNLLGVRLLAVIGHVCAIWFLLRSVDPTSKKEAKLFFFITASFTFFHVYGFISTPDTPLFFFCALYIYALRKFLSESNMRSSIFMAIAMAGLMYSKYHAALVITFSLLPLLPKLLRSPLFYLSCITALAIYSPHIWWQFQNDFVSFDYHLVRRNVHNSFEISNTTDYILICLYGTAPLLFVHVYRALWKMKATTEWHKALAWMAGGILIFFLVTTTKRYIQAQWIMVASLPLAVLTFEYYRQRISSWPGIRRLGWITLSLIVIARVYVVLPNPPWRTKYHGWKDFMVEAATHTDRWAVFHSYQAASLFSYFNYPNKKALRLREFENRPSQYDLWDAHNQMKSLDFTYFHLEDTARPSSLVLQTDEDKYFYPEKVYDAEPLDHLNITSIRVANDQDSLIINANLSWQSDSPLILNRGSTEGVRLVLVTAPDAYEKDENSTIITLPYEEQSFTPRSEKLSKFSIPNISRLGNHYAYFAYQISNLPPVKISKGFYYNDH